MLGGKNRQPLGYTIVEVMLFMAISGVMFLISATFISGKQAAAEFRQALKDTESSINEVINQVSDGDYTELGGHNCSANTATNSPPVIVSGTRAQGTNNGCVFLGKVIQFPVENKLNTYAVYTAVGRQIDAVSGDAVRTFATANPIVVDATAPSPASSVTLTSVSETSYNLELTNLLECIASCSSASPTYVNVGAFGFFGSFGGYIASAASNQSSAQQVITAVVPGTHSSPALTQAAMANALNQRMRDINANGTDVIVGGKFIRLCLKHGDRYGSITIGGSGGQQLTTKANSGYSAPCMI